jgi:predicted RNA-binding protein YlxR (DUF448 family)
VAAPVRTCIGCGEKGSPRALVRLVVEGGRVTAGRPGKGGRGAWIHAADACLDRAVKRRAFARAFRRADAAAEVADLRLLLTGSGREN